MRVHFIVFKSMLLISVGASLISCASHAPVASFSEVSRVAGDNIVEGRLIKKTGSINFEVESIKSFETKIHLIVKNKAGYIASSRLNPDNKYYANVRIPSHILDEALDEIANLGKELSRSIESSDVTEIIIDMAAELTNLQSLRDRLRQLLSKATKVEEILAVEAELTRVQTRIDSIGGQLKSLKNQVKYSEIHISASEKRIYGPLGYIGYGVWWAIEKLFVIK